MRFRLRTLLIALSVIGALSAAAFYYRRAAEKENSAIDAFSSSIALGMSRSRVDALCADACARQRGWIFIPDSFPGSSSVAALYSRTDLGASNHVVWIHFKNDAVVAVLVRIADTARFRPDDAPLDRKDKPSRSLGADFTSSR
jgi:hypothetical protein